MFQFIYVKLKKNLVMLIFTTIPVFIICLVYLNLYHLFNLFKSPVWFIFFYKRQRGIDTFYRLFYFSSH